MKVINKQVRTVIIKLGQYPELENTLITYNEICQRIIDYGWKTQTFNKNKLHSGTYRIIREKYPNFSSAMVQTARDHASEILKRTMNHNKMERHKHKLGKPLKSSHSSIRYDKRCLSVMFDKKVVSINTTFGRIRLPINPAKYYDIYKEWIYSNAQLIRRKNKEYYLNIQVKSDMPEMIGQYDVLGIDCGIYNMAVLSNNKFFNSKKLRNVKGKYRKLRSDLQSKGTKSAKKKLKKLSGKENRFVRDVNHCISKKIVSMDYDVFAMEKLSGIFQGFMIYKAIRLGKQVVMINPIYTSQQCSKCGHIDKSNRKGHIFKCVSCGFELHADLNAARNIARIGRTGSLQGVVNHPNVVHDEIKNVAIHNEMECNDKLRPQTYGLGRSN